MLDRLQTTCKLGDDFIAGGLGGSTAGIIGRRAVSS